MALLCAASFYPECEFYFRDTDNFGHAARTGHRRERVGSSASSVLADAEWGRADGRYSTSSDGRCGRQLGLRAGLFNTMGDKLCANPKARNYGGSAPSITSSTGPWSCDGGAKFHENCLPSALCESGMLGTRRIACDASVIVSSAGLLEQFWLFAAQQEEVFPDRDTTPLLFYPKEGEPAAVFSLSCSLEKHGAVHYRV